MISRHNVLMLNQILPTNNIRNIWRTVRRICTWILRLNPFTPKVSYGDIKVILTSESVDEILWCDHSNETSSAVLSYGTIYILVFYKMKFGICLEF